VSPTNYGIDVHVGRHIMDQCIYGLLAHKTRVLVTHHIHVLTKADAVWSMQSGQIQNIYHPNGRITYIHDREIPVERLL
jgi:ABC-type transport system involved in cytochrome bd biosynthesis fused ATPase/permease subunit